MEALAVSTSTIFGMMLSVLFAFGIPIVLLGVVKGTMNGQFRMGILGFVMYIAPAGLVIVVIRALLSGMTNGAVTQNPITYGLFMAVPSGVACVVTKYLMINSNYKLGNYFGHCFMYGIGFAFSQGVFRFGFREVSLLMTAFSINNGTASELLEVGEQNGITTVMDSLNAVARSTFADHFIPGTANLILMIIEVAMTGIIFLSVRYNKKTLWMSMLFAACGIDFVYYLLMNLAGSVATLFIIGILAVSMLGLNVALYKKYKEEDNASKNMGVIE